MKKLLLLVIPVASLSSCSSFSNAQQLADYDRDGVVSAAENAQFQRQKNVEDRAVYSESTKRRNVTNTVRDAADTVQGARRLQNLIKGF